MALEQSGRPARQRPTRAGANQSRGQSEQGPIMQRHKAEAHREGHLLVGAYSPAAVWGRVPRTTCPWTRSCTPLHGVRPMMLPSELVPLHLALHCISSSHLCGLAHAAPCTMVDARQREPQQTCTMVYAECSARRAAHALARDLRNEARGLHGCRSSVRLISFCSEI